MMSYPTDLSNEEFRYIEEHLPSTNRRGRPKIHAPREILDALLFYVLKSGCPWRLLAREFPPWRSVYHWSQEVAHREGTFERLRTRRAARAPERRRRLGRRDPESLALGSWTRKRSGQPTTGVGGTESAASTRPRRWRAL
jgi:putative transposase